MSRFTKDVTATIVGTYVADAAGSDYESRSAVLKTIADEYKVSENVIRGVLVVEGVYEKKEVAAKAATSGMDKEALAKAFEASFGTQLKSIRNMTKKDLEVMWERFKELSDIKEVG